MAKQKKDLSKKIMKEIKSKQIKMRPKTYFIVGSLLLGAGLAVSVMLASFFVHLTFFRFRHNLPFGFLHFGRLGFRPFLATFPWLPLLVAGGGVFGGLQLVKKYDISYKKSFFGLAMALIAFVLTIGFLLEVRGIGKKIQNLRPVRPLYKSQLVGRDWLQGEVLKVGQEELVVATADEREVKVVFDEKIRMPFGADFQVDERIRAVGKWQGDNIFLASGIGRGRRFPRPIRPTKPIIRGYPVY